METINPAIFKAYDIRGIYPTELDEDLVYKIAQAYVSVFKPNNVILAKDVRHSGPSLWESAKNGFIDAGVDVIDIGVVSTDMMYFAVANYGFDGGLTISASHNPPEYNGVKLVGKGASAISGDSGIFDIRDWVIAGNKLTSDKKGTVTTKDIMDDYCKKVLSFLENPLKKKYRIAVNPNFGMAGVALRRIIELGNLPIEVIPLNYEPDGTFPKGRPDPLRPEARTETSELVKSEHPDFAVAWDGDADRCFFFDETGNFIEGYFGTAVQAEYFLEKFPGASIFSDTRLVWAVKEAVESHGGKYIMTKAGHSFMKERMKKDKAVFGGEMSAHYYYKDFFEVDNGMVAFMVMLQIADRVEKFSDIFKKYTDKYFVSGEINTEVKSVPKVIELVKGKYNKDIKETNEIDGISYDYADWRFNVRGSNTEPLIRLNVEGLNKELVEEKTKEILAFIDSNKEIL